MVGAGLRISCAQDELAQALGVVSRALSTRTSVQILSGVLLEARGTELPIAATDMELSLRASISAEIEGDGAIVLPGKTFVDIARLLPGNDVTIEHRPTESVVHVTAGNAAYTLNTSPASTHGAACTHAKPKLSARDSPQVTEGSHSEPHPSRARGFTSSL